jgi:hypothetical protein
MRSAPAPGREAGVPVLVLLAGWVGLQLGPLALAWRESGPAALLQLNGLGPIEILALWVSVEAMLRGARDGDLRAPGWVGLGGAVLLLLPSTLVAAAVLLLCGALAAVVPRDGGRWAWRGSARFTCSGCWGATR